MGSHSLLLGIFPTQRSTLRADSFPSEPLSSLLSWCLPIVRTRETSLTVASGLHSLPAGLSDRPLYFPEPQFPHVLNDGVKACSAYMQTSLTQICAFWILSCDVMWWVYWADTEEGGEDEDEDTDSPAFQKPLPFGLWWFSRQIIHLQMSETLETWVPSLGQEDLLKEEMAIHSSILAWKIPRTEEPGSW